MRSILLLAVCSLAVWAAPLSPSTSSTSSTSSNSTSSIRENTAAENLSQTTSPKIEPNVAFEANSTQVEKRIYPSINNQRFNVAFPGFGASQNNFANAFGLGPEFSPFQEALYGQYGPRQNLLLQNSQAGFYDQGSGKGLGQTGLLFGNQGYPQGLFLGNQRYPQRLFPQGQTIPGPFGRQNQFSPNQLSSGQFDENKPQPPELDPSTKKPISIANPLNGAPNNAPELGRPTQPEITIAMGKQPEQNGPPNSEVAEGLAPNRNLGQAPGLLAGEGNGPSRLSPHQAQILQNSIPGQFFPSPQQVPLQGGSQGRFSQDAQSFQAAFPQDPQGLQVAFPQNQHREFPHVVQQRFPQGVQQRFPQGVQQRFPQGVQQRFPQGVQQGFTQGVQQGFPQSAQGGFPQGAHGRFPQSAQVGFSQGAQVEFPHGIQDAQGGFTQGSQGGFSQDTQGIYPNGAQGRFPQNLQGAFPQGSQGEFPQGAQGEFPQVFPEGLSHSAQSPQGPQGAFDLRQQERFPHTFQGPFPQGSQGTSRLGEVLQGSQRIFPQGPQGVFSHDAQRGFSLAGQGGFPQRSPASLPQDSEGFSSSSGPILSNQGRSHDSSPAQQGGEDFETPSQTPQERSVTVNQGQTSSELSGNSNSQVGSSVESRSASPGDTPVNGGLVSNAPVRPLESFRQKRPIAFPVRINPVSSMKLIPPPEPTQEKPLPTDQTSQLN